MQAPYIILDDWQGMPEILRKLRLCQTASKSKFNRQKTNNIEWAKWSWNPVTGCRHGCDYCFARDIANRFYEQGFEPSIVPSRLSAPANTKVPTARGDGWQNVFTCSMADLFGKWVPVEWIEAVLDQVRGNQQWNFLFLTKCPTRMADFDFPSNAWVGTTVDRQRRVEQAEKAFSKVEANVKFISCEPMLEPLRFERLDLFHWVIIGGASESTRTPEFHPPIEWIVDLRAQADKAGCKVYEKANLYGTGSRRKEYPK